MLEIKGINVLDLGVVESPWNAWALIWWKNRSWRRTRRAESHLPLQLGFPATAFLKLTREIPA